MADEVASGKGGMTVCFANTSAVFAGLPEPQKDEFRVYDKNQLLTTILRASSKLSIAITPIIKRTCRFISAVKMTRNYNLRILKNTYPWINPIQD